VAVQNAAPGQTLSQVLGPDLHAAVASMGALDGFERELDSKAQGRQAKSDEGLLLNINRLIGEAQQGKQASLDMLQRMNAYDPSLKLSLTDRNWLRDLQSSIRTGNPKALAAAASDAEVTGLVNDYRRRVMGIADAEVKTGSGKRYDEAEVFNQTMRRWISEYTADPKNKGRKPTYTEVQAHADAVLISNYEKMAGETPSGSSFIPDRDFTVQSLGIPRNDLFLIVQALRREGKPVDAMQIKMKWDSRQKPKAK
jgi:hypothetical protein